LACVVPAGLRSRPRSAGRAGPLTAPGQQPPKAGYRGLNSHRRPRFLRHFGLGARRRMGEGSQQHLSRGKRTTRSARSRAALQANVRYPLQAEPGGGARLRLAVAAGHRPCGRPSGKSSTRRSPGQTRKHASSHVSSRSGPVPEIAPAWTIRVTWVWPRTWPTSKNRQLASCCNLQCSAGRAAACDYLSRFLYRICA